MRLNLTSISLGALVLAVGVGGYTAEAGQRDGRGRDRNGRESQGQARERESAPPPAARAEGQQRGSARGNEQAQAPDRGVERRDQGQERGNRAAPVQPEYRNTERGRDEGRDQRRGGGIAAPRPNYDLRDNAGRPLERRRDDDRREAYRYDNRRDDRGRYEPYRGYGARPEPRHYYGSGGNLSVYFGWGNGYLFGSPWSGRVYGYIAPRAYATRLYYGDVRLQVRPRDAAVYVDGYYAGIVDDFDGVFQRLTLEVGAHQIEIDAPGLEPQFYDVYVDPARTVDIRADLYR